MAIKFNELLSWSAIDSPMYNGDLNDIRESSVYYVANSATNMPSGVTYGTVLSFMAHHSNGETFRGVQFCANTASQSAVLYMRKYISGDIWTEWKSITFS